MKLIFSKRNFKLNVFFNGVAWAAVLMLVCVIVSQVYMAVSRVEATSGTVEKEAPLHYVELDISGVGKGEAFILLNGEKYADAGNGKLIVEFADTSVVELYNGTQNDIHIEIAESSHGTEVLAQKRYVVCSKGINYICRCMCNS